MAGRPVARYSRNPFDSKEVLQQYFRSTRLVEELITNSALLRGYPNDRMKAIWIVSRGDVERRGGMENPSEAAIALAIANGIAPNMPKLEPAAADERVKECLVHFLRRQCMRREYVHINEDAYMALVRQGGGDQPGGIWSTLGLPLAWPTCPTWGMWSSTMLEL